jgi:WD40 repeat protein
VIEPLLQACDDNDASIREQARLTLQQLKRMEAREALCRVVIDHDHTTAHEVALAANYTPRDEYQRSLFFFLTEQWDRYDALDFDRHLLSTVYESASPLLRQRLTEKLRLTGRTDFLTIVAGKDVRSRVAVMTPDETTFMVQMLIDHKEWARLWDLVFVLPFSWSVRIVETLAQHVWKPGLGDEQQTYETLVALVSRDMVTTRDAISRSVPPAVQQARSRVVGRVNDVAFSPVRPVIAIGTGQRKLVLWNFQQAQREQVLNGFNHAIGRVTFTPDDTLLCAERTHGEAACAIHVWRDGKRFSLGSHQGSVTAIVPIGDSQILATGRDQKVAVWDVSTGQEVQKRQLQFWARAACVAVDGQRAALLHDGVTLVALPQLTPLARTTEWTWRGVVRCAAFTPHGEALLMGKFAGGVIVCEHVGQRLRQLGRPFTTHQGQVQAIEVLHHREVVITAASEGTVRFTAWANHAAIGEVRVPGERLTSLHVSPDGAFMAIGDSDASMSLWDLRVLDIPILLARPFAHAVPSHLAAVSALASNRELPVAVQHALQFVECVLRHRFRYDVEIDAVPTIRAGEFDIAIEG